MLTKSDELPGVMVKDEERTPFGLGWEFRRRGLKPKNCPFKDQESVRKFNEGYQKFICSDYQVNKAMLRGLDG